MFGWQSEELHAQSRLETFLNNAPFVRTGVFGERPRIETGHHERLISRKVDHRTNAERADKL
jgi:hypothetical protein